MPQRPSAARARTRTRVGQPLRRPISLTEPLESRTLMAAVSDDFNDGNDAGWARYAPLTQFGAPGTYTFPDGAYRIQAAESPAPGQAGPGRAGAFRQDATYTDFIASVDLLDWDPALDQAFGFLARVATPGLGTTNGYALSISTEPDGTGDFDISLVTGEAPDDLDPSRPVFLDPGNDYRLVFEGQGPRLIGRLYDLADLSRPIAMTTAVDETYTSGMTGIFVYANTGDGLGTADATFDNFNASERGSTVAYWRFEEGDDGAPFPGPSTPGGESGLALDEAMGDDPLRTWSIDTSPVYTANVPAATVTGTGAANTRSLDFTPGEFSDDIYTAQAGDLNAHAFPQFTVETSFNFDTLGWMNLVGKDGAGGDVGVAPLQLKRRNDNGLLQIEIRDGSNTERQVSSLEPIVAGRWYHAAAVSDGENLSLYLDDTTVPGGYVLQGTVPITDGLVRTDGTWVVGRGFFDGAITDWADAKIDEVRISDVALAPDDFLFASDAPSAVNVTQVFVNGPTLRDGSAAFKAAAGVDATFGYAVPGGVVQTTPLSWLGGINAVSIRFNADVASALAQGDLVINSSGGPVATTGFTYDAATRTGTWTFAAVTRDKLRFVLDDAGIPGLDGNWSNPTEAFPGVGGDSYPSGDGTAGGDFNFRVNVLNGDVSGDGQVNATDVAEIKRRLTRRPNDGVTDPLRMYTIFSDVNGDGVINANDLAQVKGRLTQRINTLPDPATALLAD